MDNPQDKLAELEAMSREQDERHEARMGELEGERNAIVRGWIEDASATIAADLSATNMAQVEALKQRLERLGLLDIEGDPDGEVLIGTINDLATGEVVTALAFDGLTYWENGRDLMVQREAAGRVKFTTVDDDGVPVEPWQDAPPPPGRAAAN